VTSASLIKIILGITTFSQYVKERLQAKRLTRNAQRILPELDDVMITNHQTYRNSIVKHQYGKNL
jgi:hypothetical protein